ESLFQIGFAGSEFSTNREIPSPCSTSARHADFQLRLEILRKELFTSSLQPLLEVLVYAMTKNVTEAVIPTCLSYRVRHLMTVSCFRYKSTDVNDRNKRRHIAGHIVHALSIHYINGNRRHTACQVKG